MINEEMNSSSYGDEDDHLSS